MQRVYGVAETLYAKSMRLPVSEHIWIRFIVPHEKLGKPCSIRHFMISHWRCISTNPERCLRYIFFNETFHPSSVSSAGIWFNVPLRYKKYQCWSNDILNNVAHELKKSYSAIRLTLHQSPPHSLYLSVSPSIFPFLNMFVYLKKVSCNYKIFSNLDRLFFLRQDQKWVQFWALGIFKYELNGPKYDLLWLTVSESLSIGWWDPMKSHTNSHVEYYVKKHE